MPKGKFQRALREDVFERVRTDHNLVALVQYCRADPSLSIFLRGPRDLDVYWEGSVVFHVTISSGKLRVGSEHDQPVEDLPTSFDDWDPARLPEYIAWVKDLRAARVATKTPELRFEAAVIRDNQAAGSPVMVLDRQIAGPGGKDQLDLMLLDVGSSRLALAELKVETNKEVGGPVLQQLQRYVGAFGALTHEYTEVLTQMQKLGLTANRQATIDQLGQPIPIVMLAGLSVKKLGAQKDSSLLHALWTANKELLAEDPKWDGRMLVFPRHAEQSFSIPTSLQDLPGIEEWCDRNLS